MLAATVVALTVVAFTAPAAAQPAAPVLQAHVSGSTVIAGWAPVPGAVSYRVEAGLTPVQMLAGYEIVQNGFSISAPQGTYYLRVFARNAQGLSAPSNVVGVAVSSTLAPPAPPTGLVASTAGTSVNFNVSLPAGPLTGLVLAAGLGPGQTQAAIPMPMSSQSSLHNVPPGTYFARMHAIGPGGASGPSNEVRITVAPASCLPPGVPVVQVQASGSTVSISWSPVAGAAGYQLLASLSPGGAPIVSQAVPATTTAVSYPGVATGTYYVRVVAVNACGAMATSADATLVVTAPPGGNRTPNPPSPTPPNYLRLPNREAVVQQMAQLYPNELRNSCGNNTWLFRLVQRLRQEDTRWGLNWKRSRVGDMSQDAITYNYGPEADEGTRFVHVVDVIIGHCGGSPGAGWIDQTIMWTTGATWTLQPYTAAGYPR